MNVIFLSPLGICTSHQSLLKRVFIESWNNHPISTEHNQTPNQLFCQGIISQAQEPHSTLTPTSSNHPISRDSVNVPSEKFQPCNALLTTLQSITVSVSADNQDNGITSYFNKCCEYCRSASYEWL